MIRHVTSIFSFVWQLLLENCDEHVLQCLVLRYLSKRSYYNVSSHKDKSSMESWSDEEDARELEGAKNTLGMFLKIKYQCPELFCFVIPQQVLKICFQYLFRV